MTTSTTSETREPLPARVERSIEEVRRTLNRHLILDALLCGAGAAITAGAPALLVVALTGLPILVACTITALAFAASAAWELRRRWHDALDAALVLDRVLDAKDRFSSALQFARTEDPPSLHRLQIKEAGAFLDGIASIPKPPD